jgi:methionyl-tRNA synthetase
MTPAATEPRREESGLARTKRTIITSALPYANGDIHVGHVCSTYVPADIYRRFLRISGEEVVYVCGADEHGTPIEIAAREKGVSPSRTSRAWGWSSTTTTGPTARRTGT